MAAVAVCEAIESVSEKKADIKWVNDIYMDGKKVCGILSEGNYDLEDGNLDAVIVGIGINVYPPVSGFPKEIASRAGSVFEDSSSGKRNFLTAEVLNRFMAYYKGLSTNDHLEEYKRRSLVIGRVVEISKNGQKKRARVLGLNDDCALLIKYDDGTEDTLIAGEVRIIGID
jgi:BirA family biotin operon repressor/biotin-[acetyl-CoA-carboxylase] ligase